MLRWMSSVANDEARYTRVTMVLAAAIIAAMGALAAVALRP